jgi:YD repeat-containing protein
LTIGRYPAGGGTADAWMAGYIDDLRITKGLARYTEAFTPPASQFTSGGRDSGITGYLPGDLQSTTNPAGQVTQYLQYDPAGRVRKVSAPSGTVTDITYTQRGKVNTMTVTPSGGVPRTTTYTYDAVGQLTRRSLPDGTSEAYTYDGAHRLTGTQDARGNWVVYTLDAEGNRVGEDLINPGGGTERSIARSYDSLNRVQQVASAYVNSNSPLAHDADFGKVQLLLHGNGADGAKAFIDNSASGRTPSLVGGPVLSMTERKFGSSSISFNGATDALSYGNDSGLNLATGDFTIEAWVYLTSLATSRTILQKDQTYGATVTSYALLVEKTGGLSCQVGTGSGSSYSQWFKSAGGLISAGAWHHVACTRQGTTIRLFVDGALAQTGTQTGTPTDGGKPLTIGRFPAGGGTADGWMAGYIDDLRITKGLARYTEAFTPPDYEFPNQGQ